MFEMILRSLFPYTVVVLLIREIIFGRLRIASSNLVFEFASTNHYALPFLFVNIS